MADSDKVELMDVAPVQLVSIAASLIPFLEHDDANRALMGSNMQRQAVPLLQTQVPTVGTGLESKAARDSGAVVVAKRDGVVKYVDSERILIQPNEDQLNQIFEPNKIDEYQLKKFQRSNQDTCVNQRPIVVSGQSVKRGDVIADGPACKNGELALGKELIVAFMPWNGYNFEDAIIINERCVKEDVFTSVHIERFEVQVRETKRGPEELTAELPNVSDDAVRYLDEEGVVTVGSEVESGDILVGKVTPKGEKESTPEERLLRAIFGEKAGDVNNTSHNAPPSMKGVVINTVNLKRKEFSKEERDKEKKNIARVEAYYNTLLRRIAEKRNKKIKSMLENIRIKDILESDSREPIAPSGTVLKSSRIKTLKIDALARDTEWTEDPIINANIREALSIADKLMILAKEDMEIEKNKIVRGDQLPPGVLKLVKVDVAMKRKISVGDKMAGRHGNKGVVSIIVPEEDMPFLPDGTSVDIVLNPLGVPSRMNIGQLLETHLGWALSKCGEICQTPVFSGASIEEIKQWMEGNGIPTGGKMTLYDGKTGQPFDNPVTVGMMYILKLAHLADDKLHARSIGPYSLVNSNLWRKSSIWRTEIRRNGSMALEAYGASYCLQKFDS
jgi:DNA-directed RNA polymerase subunit beta